MINPSIHAELQVWLEQAIQAQALPLPQPGLYQHIASCDHCRGIMIFAAQSYPALFPSPKDISCDQACEDLPSFIEAEQNQPQQAIMAFPALWWHLLSCEDCAELYAVLRIALDPEQPIDLTPSIVKIEQPSMPAALASELLQATAPAYELTFPRTFLNQALQIRPQPTIRRYRSNLDSTEKIKIIEDNPELQIGNTRYQLKIWLKTTPDSWSLIVSLEPTFAGWLMVQFGEHSYRQKFDQHGTITLNHLPNEQLLMPTGPALTLSIDPAGDSN